MSRCRFPVGRTHGCSDAVPVIFMAEFASRSSCGSKVLFVVVFSRVPYVLCVTFLGWSFVGSRGDPANRQWRALVRNCEALIQIGG